MGWQSAWPWPSRSGWTTVSGRCHRLTVRRSRRRRSSADGGGVAAAAAAGLPQPGATPVPPRPSVPTSLRWRGTSIPSGRRAGGPFGAGALVLRAVRPAATVADHSAVRSRYGTPAQPRATQRNPERTPYNRSHRIPGRRCGRLHPPDTAVVTSTGPFGDAGSLRRPGGGGGLLRSDPGRDRRGLRGAHGLRRPARAGAARRRSGAGPSHGQGRDRPGGVPGVDSAGAGQPERGGVVVGIRS